MKHEIFEILESVYRQTVDRNIDHGYMMAYLSETRGVNTDIRFIANEIWEAINSKPFINIRKNGDGKIIHAEKHVDDIKLSGNYFLIEPSVFVSIDITGEIGKKTSAFIPPKSHYIRDGKLNKPSYDIRQTSDRLEINKNLFIETISHELMHTYRLLNIMLSGNDNEDFNRYEAYSNYADIKYDGTFADMVKQMMYLSDQDEINAQSASLEAYLRQHKEINFTNYKQYIENMPLYNRVITNLKDYLFKLRAVADDERIRVFFGEEYAKLIGKKNQKSNKQYFLGCYKKLRYRLSRQLSYAMKQFYKILEYILIDEKRERVLPEGIYYIEDFNNILREKMR